ncbi:alpha/beta fold hydrolase [Nakamurella sp. YIM 132087]|uniref:Alpha/beta fold hydrolase n=1 Tax=Nakamurella alba TaxID=2665158 RepID=A0A7K1FRR0_9ACTN|nr:alpha/beta hydrolase [Nakamurella alba]MTD16832.1 alpha/beta fold hydrolase [Nakamurella alba]
MTEYVTTARGDRIGYDLRGSGPALVFVAGAGPFRAMDPWTTETAEKAAGLGLTTLVFDRTGRGDSPAGGRLDLDRELDTIRAVIDVAGGPAVLCGHSSGCSIVLRAAAAWLPVNGLALWEAPLAGSAADTASWSDGIESLIDAGDLEGATELYMRDMPPEWLAGAKASPEWGVIAASVVAKRADAQSLAWATAALEAAMAGEGALPALGIPVLSMYGTETFPEMPVAAARIAAAIPGTSVEEMPGAQHAWEPGPMADRLAAFTLAAAG